MSNPSQIRYNVVPKFIGSIPPGERVTWEFQADDEGQWIEAQSAVTRISNLEAELREKQTEIERLTAQNKMLIELQANHAWWVKRGGELEAKNTELQHRVEALCNGLEKAVNIHGARPLSVHQGQGKEDCPFCSLVRLLKAARSESAAQVEKP